MSFLKKSKEFIENVLFDFDMPFGPMLIIGTILIAIVGLLPIESETGILIILLKNVFTNLVVGVIVTILFFVMFAEWLFLSCLEDNKEKLNFVQTLGYKTLALFGSLFFLPIYLMVVGLIELTKYIIVNYQKSLPVIGVIALIAVGLFIFIKVNQYLVNKNVDKNIAEERKRIVELNKREAEYRIQMVKAKRIKEKNKAKKGGKK